MVFPLARVRVQKRTPVLKLVADFIALSALVLVSQSGCRSAPSQAASKAAAKTAAKVARVPTMTKPQRLLMAHYMPWYESKPVSGQWGWHWTMNHYNPDKVEAETGGVKAQPGRQQGASQFRPLIGLYDSGDMDALKCQVALMKLAGIDGVIIDWYGNEDFNDYAILNRNTLKLIPLLQQAGLRFAICFEDQSVARKVDGGRFAATEAVAHGQRLMGWMNENFFANPAYLQLDGRPVLLTFGEPYYKDEQWNQIFSGLTTKPLYFTEHVIRAKTAAIGAFDWPVPKDGVEGALREQNAFYERAGSWPYFIAAAYPRFQDIYVQAGVHASWGRIDDRGGRTYTETLQRALQSQARIVQLVTWNDWGEGTQIEPSQEFGYRDLETTQKMRRQHLDARFSATAADLRLPVEWYRLKKAASNPYREKLERFFPLIAAGRTKEARALLAQAKK